MNALMDIPQTDVMEAKLAALEAELPEPAAPIREQVDPPADTQPAAPKQDVPETPIPPADALPAADKPPIDATKDSPPEPKGSNFAKDAQRRDTSWKELNRQKAEFKTQQDGIAAREQAIAQCEARLTQERAKLHQKSPPEKFEREAATLIAAHESTSRNAKDFADKAKELEEKGDYKGAALAESKAEELKELAVVQKAKAKEFKDYADNLRKNPPADIKQIEQQQAQALQHYTLEAAKKWPDLAVTGSEFQKTVVQSESTLAKAGVDIRENPVLRYYIAEFAAAQAAAGRVPAMDKELGQLRAKVKELELATAPGGGSQAVTTPKTGDAPLSEEDEGEALRAMAVQRGRLN